MQKIIGAIFAAVFISCITFSAFSSSLTLTGAGGNSGPAAIGTPILLGSKVQAGGTTIAITTTIDAPAGSVIVVGCLANASFSTFSIADGANTYTTAISIINSDVISNSGILAAKLNSGSTITATAGATVNDGFCAAAYVTGLSSATPDKTASASANSATTAALTIANEIAFGMPLAFNSGSNPGAVSMTSGFSILASQTNYGVDIFSTAFGYKVVSATTAVTFSWSATTTAAQSIVATYKGN